MKKKFVVVLILTLLCNIFITSDSVVNVYAEEGVDSAASLGTSISLTPVSKVIQLNSNTVYDDSFEVKNDGEGLMKIEVYSAPYSYVYSEEQDVYKLGFNNENNYTQISRWITFKDSAGNYVDNPTFTIEPKSALNIDFRIKTPESIPNGGQYAVIFAHTLTSNTSSSGIRTEASPGLVIYGRSNEGDSIIDAEFSNLTIARGTLENNKDKNNIYGTAKVKNNGNVDFTAYGTLRVEGLFGNVKYETPSTAGRISVIPESELVVSDEWKDTPGVGFFKITWTVKVGEKTETIEKKIFIISPLAIILTIILLTFIIMWIIIVSRRRKERRSRLAV